MAFDQELSASRRKQLNVLLAVVLGGALAGYLAGTRTMARPEPDPSRAARTATGGEQAVPSESYRERRQRRYGPSSQVSSPLDGLRAGGPKLGDPVAVSGDRHAETVAARTKLRAFDGAPPVVPHPIDEQSAHSCVACHASGLWIEGRRAPVMSHEPHGNCTQCHVPAERDGPANDDGWDNSFAGVESPGLGDRAWDGAPPVIPHTTHMRERCGACHGLNGPEGLRTTHPERESCTQCHGLTTVEQPWPL